MEQKIPVFRPKQTLPFGAAHTYMAHTSPPPGLNLGRTYLGAIKIARSLNENMRTIYTWFESALWASDKAFKAADERLLARSVRHCWKQEWLSRRLSRPNFIRVRARSNKVSSACGLIAHSRCIKHTVEIYKWGSTIGVLKSRFPAFFSSESRHPALFYAWIPIPPHSFTRFFAWLLK